MAVARAKIPRVTHLIHMLVCVCSLGFVFPNAFVENMERVAYVANEDVDKKKT